MPSDPSPPLVSLHPRSSSGRVPTTTSPSNSRKSAHIDARYHRLRHEVVNARSLRFVYVPTADQAADALTKPLPAPAVRRFHDAMAGTAPLPLPDLAGPPGRIGLSVLRPDKFPDLRMV